MSDRTPRTQALLDEAAGRIHAYAKRTVESAVAIGRELMMVQSVLASEGKFLAWVHEEFNWSESTARSFMSVAKRGVRIADANINVDLTALYLLCRPSTPEHVREQVIERGQRGERINRQAVADLLENEGGREEHSEETAAIVAKLRDIDVVGEDPDQVASGVEPVLRPHLASRARALAHWLHKLAKSLEGHS